jgi:hypothetical protein
MLRLLLIALFFVLNAGCSSQDIRQGIYAGFYEAGRIEDRRHNSPSERANRPDVGYEQYSNERKEIIENDTH